MSVTKQEVTEMAYTISLIGNGSKKLIEVADSLDDAKAVIRSMFAEMICDEDEENPDHFDVFAFTGSMSETFSIEPIKV